MDVVVSSTEGRGLNWRRFTEALNSVTFSAEEESRIVTE